MEGRSHSMKAAGSEYHKLKAVKAFRRDQVAILSSLPPYKGGFYCNLKKLLYYICAYESYPVCRKSRDGVFYAQARAKEYAAEAAHGPRGE